MTPTEAIPLLVVVLLLVAAGGADVEQMDVTFDGDRTVASIDDVLVVAGGTAEIPASAAVAGDLYVIGGTVRVAGRLSGDATVLGGTLVVADGAELSGTLQTIAGEAVVEPGASVGRTVAVADAVPEPSPWRQATFLLLQVLVLGGFGWWIDRRHPEFLPTVGAAATEHPLVSGVVGALAALTLLVGLVYMAFTIVLIPVTVVGLFAELAVVAYGQVALGSLVGRRLPIERSGLATAAGVAVLVVGLEVAGAVPVVGAIAQLSILVVGFGAVVLTYFGLKRFEPATIPEGPA